MSVPQDEVNLLVIQALKDILFLLHPGTGTGVSPPMKTLGELAHMAGRLEWSVQNLREGT